MESFKNFISYKTKKSSLQSTFYCVELLQPERKCAVENSTLDLMSHAERQGK